MLDFVHLHNHSDYSLLDGAASVENLVAKARAFDMPALALTDHGNMFGALKFYRECRKQGIKPIVGSEFYVAPESRTHKAGGEKRYYHLVLLARDEQGYKNLLKLSSLGYTEGFYYKPRIDDELLQRYHEGITALTACLGGEIPRLILENRYDQARERAVYYRDLFGRDSFFLELQNHGIPDQKTVIKEMVRLARETGIPLVGTNDIHYTDKSDSLSQDILICIGINKKLSDGSRLKFEFPEFYFKSQEEMAAVFSGLDADIQKQVLQNTKLIAESCDLTIPLPGPRLPDFQASAHHDLYSYLTELAQAGLESRFPQINDELKDRLEYELSIINSMGYSGYFLVVWDFIRFAREHMIPVGPGRGSGAGSLVAYSLGITDIDPLKYGLLFERFLNPERVSMPDFDIDFCYEGRGQVIDYVIQKYGADKVGQIITFGTLKARAVIRDVARVLDLPYAEADRIAKLIPAGPKIDLKKALKLEPELAEIKDKGEIYRQLLETSLKLEGLSRHASTHAAGIVIGRENLTEYVPLYRDTKTGSISTQYTMDYLEDCGLVKMDFLGLKTLTLMKNTLGLLTNRGIDLKLHDIREDDPVTFELLGEGKSTCIFQFESQGMQEILRRTKPESISDLIALNALYRPGPMEFIDKFIKAKRGIVPIEYPLPDLKDILEETYGVIVYQEQVMEIARKVAGFSLGQADILRRAMGKKKPEVMTQQKARFVEGALSNGYSKKIADQIFELLIPFAGYGFNKSHAAAYAVLAYQTAYLKANYPAEFMAANLTNEINSTDKLSEYIAESRDMGLEILPPDINLSDKDFTVVDGRIVYGLRGIKNVGSAAVDEILAERRKNGKFTDFVQFLERVDSKVANRKVLETLICCGVFDRCGNDQDGRDRDRSDLKGRVNRATLHNNLDRILEMVSQYKESRRYGQVTLFDLHSEGVFEVEWEQFEEWPALERLNHEKQNLGFYFSGHPLDKFKKLMEAQVNLDLAVLDRAQTERTYTVIGLLKEIKEINTRTGKRMAFGQLEDFRGTVELVIFSKTYEECRELLTKDRVLAVNGKIDRSRGEAKLKVEKIQEPGHLKKQEPREIHVRFARDQADEELFLRLRDFMVDQPGKCSVYFHLNGSGTQEIVIKASPQISLTPTDEVLQEVRDYAAVEEVWSE